MASCEFTIPMLSVKLKNGGMIFYTRLTGFILESPIHEDIIIDSTHLTTEQALKLILQEF